MVGINYKSIRQGYTKSKMQFKSSASMSYFVAALKWGSMVPEQFEFGVVSYNRLLST